MVDGANHLASSSKSEHRSLIPDEKAGGKTGQDELDIHALGSQLLTAILDLRDENGRQTAIDFIDLPSRELYPHYYTVIMAPTCLNSIRARLDGGSFENLSDVHGAVVQLCWNAQKYNVTGSQIWEGAKNIKKTSKTILDSLQPRQLPTSSSSLSSRPTRISLVTKRSLPSDQSSDTLVDPSSPSVEKRRKTTGEVVPLAKSDIILQGLVDGQKAELAALRTQLASESETHRKFANEASAVQGKLRRALNQAIAEGETHMSLFELSKAKAQEKQFCTGSRAEVATHDALKTELTELEERLARRDVTILALKEEKLKARDAQVANCTTLRATVDKLKSRTVKLETNLAISRQSRKEEATTNAQLRSEAEVSRTKLNESYGQRSSLSAIIQGFETKETKLKRQNSDIAKALDTAEAELRTINARLSQAQASVQELTATTDEVTLDRDSLKELNSTLLIERFHARWERDNEIKAKDAVHKELTEATTTFETRLAEVQAAHDRVQELHTTHLAHPLSVQVDAMLPSYEQLHWLLQNVGDSSEQKRARGLMRGMALLSSRMEEKVRERWEGARAEGGEGGE